MPQGIVDVPTTHIFKLAYPGHPFSPFWLVKLFFDFSLNKISFLPKGVLPHLFLKLPTYRGRCPNHLCFLLLLFLWNRSESNE